MNYSWLQTLSLLLLFLSWPMRSYTLLTALLTTPYQPITAAALPTRHTHTHTVVVVTGNALLTRYCWHLTNLAQLMNYSLITAITNNRQVYYNTKYNKDENNKLVISCAKERSAPHITPNYIYIYIYNILYYPLNQTLTQLTWEMTS